MLRPVSTTDVPSAGRTSTELVDLLGEGIETVEGDGTTRGLFVGDVCYKVRRINVFITSPMALAALTMLLINACTALLPMRHAFGSGIYLLKTKRGK